MPSALLEQLHEHRNEFKAFLTSRLGNAADAEDLLQTSLIKALQKSDTLRENTKFTAWFYQILHRAIIDHVRSRHAATRRDDAWAADEIATRDTDVDRQACRCLAQLLPTLKPAQAELLRRVEMEGQSVADAARALGLTPNNASVTLHRARENLRQRLEEFCGPCADETCFDCRCDD